MNKLKLFLKIILKITKWKLIFTFFAAFFAAFFAVYSYFLEKLKIIFSITPGKISFDFNITENFKMTLVIFDIKNKNFLSFNINLNSDLATKDLSKENLILKIVLKLFSSMLKPAILQLSEAINKALENKDELTEEKLKELEEGKAQVQQLIDLM